MKERMEAEDKTVAIDSTDLDSPAPTAWLWCMHCRRVFQAEHLRVDFLGYREECPFCGALGLGVDIFPWERFRARGQPKSESELRHGMVVD